jgi:hypothetical protein
MQLILDERRKFFRQYPYNILNDKAVLRSVRLCGCMVVKTERQRQKKGIFKTDRIFSVKICKAWK